MGSGNNTSIPESELGIIPRVVRDIYERAERARVTRGVAVEIRVTYLEIYQEELKDLLHPTPVAPIGAKFGSSSSSAHATPITIREESSGGIVLTGVREELVDDYSSMMRVLTRGSVSRTTGSTKMNEHSSRSHAIFTIHIQQRQTTKRSATTGANRAEITRAKFHLVDRQ